MERRYERCSLPAPYFQVSRLWSAAELIEKGADLGMLAHPGQFKNFTRQGSSLHPALRPQLPRMNATWSVIGSVPCPSNTASAPPSPVD